MTYHTKVSNGIMDGNKNGGTGWRANVLALVMALNTSNGRKIKRLGKVHKQEGKKVVELKHQHEKRSPRKGFIKKKILEPKIS